MYPAAAAPSWAPGLSKIQGLASIVAIATTALVVWTLWAPRATPNAAATPRALIQTTPFIRNTGEFEPRIAYWSRTALGDTYVLTDGRLLHAIAAGPTAGNKLRKVWVVVESITGSGAIEPRVGRESTTSLTRLSQDTRTSTTSKAFEQLDLPDAWLGIDSSVRQSAAGIERLFTVRPGAQPQQIRIALEGAESLQLTSEGELRVGTGVGALRYRKPAAFQLDARNHRVPVAVRYRVLADHRSFGFELGEYDATNTLIIDPVLQGTYFGRSGSESVMAMAIDPTSGDLLVSGLWQSVPPPVVRGGFQELSQVLAVFIARFDRKLEQVSQMTLLGGSSDEVVHDMAIDPVSGEVFVTGSTDSADFPGGGGGAEPAIAFGRVDGFVSRFSSDLRTLEQTTFFGGSRGRALPQAIAINPNTRDVYVAGSGVGGAVVVRYNEALTQVLSRNALQGNTPFGSACGLAINALTGDVYVTGVTSSWSFPGGAGGAFSSSTHTPTFTRAFVSRFDATLTHLLQSTYIWDGQTEAYLVGETRKVPVVVAAATGDVFVAAQTISDLGPISGGAQSTFGGHNRDALVVRFSGDLRQAKGATYFGGSDDEYATSLGLSLDSQHVYLGGYSYSASLPGSTQTGRVGQNNAYLSRISADLSTLEGTVYGLGALADELAMLVHPTTGEVYIGGDAFDGLPQTRGALQPDYVPSPFPAGTTDAYVLRFDPALSTSASTAPEPYSFAAQSGVARGSTVTSAAARIYGLTQPAAITVTGGEYSIDDGPFTSTAGTVERSQRVRVQHTAAATTNTQTQTTLTIGGVNATFLSTTESGSDTTPAPFSFGTAAPVPRSLSITSNRISVQSTNAPTAISVSGGEYAVDGGAFTGAAGTINSGQSVVVRQITGAGYAEQKDTVLTIGGTSATFRTITDALDTTPHAFAFPSLPVAPADTDIASEVASIIGFNAPAPLSVTNGSTSVFNTTGGTTPAGFVSPFDNVVVQVHTGSAGTTTTGTVTIGGVTGTFSATVPGPIPVGAVPDAFTIPPVNNAETLAWVESAPVTLTNLTVDSPIEITGTNVQNTEWFDPNWGVFRTASGIGTATFPPGQPLRVRLVPLAPGVTSYLTISVGGKTATFNVNTRSNDATPDPFQFADHSDVTPGSTVVTEMISITGIDSPAAFTATGCQANVNGQLQTQGTLNPGSTFSLSIVAPSGSGQTATCTITVGGVSDTVRVTTLSSGSGGNPGGNPGSGSGGGGGALDAVFLGFLSLISLVAWAKSLQVRDLRSRRFVRRRATSARR